MLKLPLNLYARCAFALAFFGYGTAVGQYKLPPYSLLQETKLFLSNLLPQRKTQYRGEAELLDYAFVDKTVKSGLYYEPIKTFEDLRYHNERIFMLSRGFKSAFHELKLIKTTQFKLTKNTPSIVRVDFSYQNKNHSAFAYSAYPVECNNSTRASLIIPGSGLNQSMPIFNDDKSNYHNGVLESIRPFGSNVFVFIKPNEDILAWHNGNNRKISGDFIWNWHLNRNGSFSGSYIVQSLAIVKWMQACFSQTLVAGLSQGGGAALLNALQSQPDIAIIASGHSIIFDDIEWSSNGQIIGVPGFSELSKKEYLVKSINDSSTQFLFTWGKAERGTYKIEAHEQRTASVIKHLPNVLISIHNGGHEFPVEPIRSFVKDNIK